jgi:cytochrome P450
MSVISRAMFEVDIGEDFSDAAQALNQMLEYTSASTTTIIDMPLFVPTPRNQRLKRAKQTVADFISTIVTKRRQEGLSQDLLSMLMSAKDADTGELMTDEQLHDEILITFFAGHETTASLLTWTLYNLTQNPSVEAKLHAELQSVLGGRKPTLEDFQNLPYTRMILDETLRLYSPVAVVARDATEDDVVDGFTIPKGSMVVVMPYITHRHPEFWEKPLEYYPEHFLPEAVAKRPRYAYYPFGAGQRICIGLHFALMEGMLILSEVAQHYKFRLAVPHDGSVKFIGVIRPAHPIMMTIEPR